MTTSSQQPKTTLQAVVERSVETQEAAKRILAPQELIFSCQGMVKSIAWKIHRKMPASVELDDLIAYGQVGLAQAAKEFDASRGQFTTYAYHRIRGAILDGVSQMSWFSRQAYHASRYERMANELMALETEATDAGAGGNADVKWLAGLSGSLSVAYLSSMKGEENPEQTLEDGEAEDPEVAAAFSEARGKLMALIAALPAEAGQLIRAVYFEGVTLSEAGKKLGISKAWASRLHARTLEKLAASLRRVGLGQ